jgi:hypothetical protein
VELRVVGVELVLVASFSEQFWPVSAQTQQQQLAI